MGRPVGGGDGAARRADQQRRPHIHRAQRDQRRGHCPAVRQQQDDQVPEQGTPGGGRRGAEAQRVQDDVLAEGAGIDQHRGRQGQRGQPGGRCRAPERGALPPPYREYGDDHRDGRPGGPLQHGGHPDDQARAPGMTPLCENSRSAARSTTPTSICALPITDRYSSGTAAAPATATMAGARAHGVDDRAATRAAQAYPAAPTRPHTFCEVWSGGPPRAPTPRTPQAPSPRPRTGRRRRTHAARVSTARRPTPGQAGRGDGARRPYPGLTRVSASSYRSPVRRFAGPARGRRGQALTRRHSRGSCERCLQGSAYEPQGGAHTVVLAPRGAPPVRLFSTRYAAKTSTATTAQVRAAATSWRGQ